MCRDVPDTTTFCSAWVTWTNNAWLPWIMQPPCFHPDPKHVFSKQTASLFSWQDVCVNNRYSNLFSRHRGRKLPCNLLYYLACCLVFFPSPLPLALARSTPSPAIRGALVDKHINENINSNMLVVLSQYALWKRCFFSSLSVSLARSLALSPPVTTAACHKWITRLWNINPAWHTSLTKEAKCEDTGGDKQTRPA